MGNLFSKCCCLKRKKIQHQTIPVPSFLPNEPTTTHTDHLLFNLNPTYKINNSPQFNTNPLVLPSPPTSIFPNAPTTPPRYNTMTLSM